LAEIERITDDTKFNGKSLVDGENLSITDTNNMGGNNLLTSTQGISAINFNDNKGDGVIRLSYDSATSQFTARDLISGNVQIVTVSATTLSIGDTETLRFGSLGMEVIIDNN